MTKDRPTTIVVAHVTYSWPEAEVVCSMLNAAGIPAILADRNTVGLLWHQALAFGGFRIFVLARDIEEANSILTEFQSATPSETRPESNAFWRQPLRNSVWLLLTFLIGVWAPAWLRKRKS